MAQNDQDVVIVSACRTPIGRIRGQLSKVRPDDMLAHVFDKARARSQISPEVFEEIFAGCANQAGEDNRNVARMSGLLAGFGHQVPGVTVNRLCASGLEAIVQAARGIALSDYQVVMAGGVESMSRAPWAISKPEQAFASGAPKAYDTALGWRFENPKMKALFELESMGQTAENVAKAHQIDRKRQDEFALLSHQKAVMAQEAGYFDAEIEAIHAPVDRKNTALIQKDEGPRKDTSLEKLSQLKAVFAKDGTVTAGNSSTLNDGASALVLCSRAYAKAHGLKVKAKILASASAGVAPSLMGTGPIFSTEKLLKKARMSVSDLDYIELNEAFASQALAVIDALQLPAERVNVWGGAIALGHPLGCSGARIVTTLCSVLEKHNANVGLATLCVGVGQGLSVLLERAE